MSEITNHRVDYSEVYRRIKARKKLFFKTLSIAFIVSCLIIFPKPRYYTSSVMLAPEVANEDAAGGLASIASSFGFNIGGGANDAIYPMLYPDLFKSPQFIFDLLKIRVTYKPEDGDVVNVDYYTYLKKYQKQNWLTEPFKKLFRKIKASLSSDEVGTSVDSADQLNPLTLTKKDFEIMEAVGDLIVCSIDKKTDVATISVTDQDPVLSAILADSVRCHLQNYITDLRTAKARMDVAYYQALVDSTYLEYEAASEMYAAFADAHQGTQRQIYLTQLEKLQNDASIKYETYNTMMVQLTAAKAKLQDKTPVFTQLQTSVAPVKPAGPKRMIFVGAMLALTIFGTFVYVIRDIIRSRI